MKLQAEQAIKTFQSKFTKEAIAQFFARHCSPKRILLLLRSIGRADITIALILLGLLALINILGYLLAGYFVSNDPEQNSTDVLKWVSLLYLIMLFKACTSFSQMHNPITQRDYLLLPASQFEKYFTPLFYLFIVFPIAITLICVGFSSVLYFVAKLLAIKAGKIFIIQTGLPLSWQASGDNFDRGNLIVFFIYFTGAIFFKRLVIFKMLGVGLLYMIGLLIVILITGVIVLGRDFSSFNLNIDNFNFGAIRDRFTTNANLPTEIFYFMTIVFGVIIGYLRIGEQEATATTNKKGLRRL